jgi:hypothetical protein
MPAFYAEAKYVTRRDGFLSTIANPLMSIYVNENGQSLVVPDVIVHMRTPRTGVANDGVGCLDNNGPIRSDSGLGIAIPFLDLILYKVTACMEEPREDRLVRIPPGAARALSRYVSKAVERLDPARYRQEAAYVAALFARLDGIVYHRPNLTIEIRSTVVADRGPNSAESRWGADFGIVARITGRNEVIEKGVLGQAKRGSLLQLPHNDGEQFRRQVMKMAEATEALVGLEVPTARLESPVIRIVEVPNMQQGIPFRRSFRRLDFSIKPFNPEEPPVFLGDALPIGKYLYTELLRCLHGDTGERLVRGLEDSSLTSLLVEVRTGANR